MSQADLTIMTLALCPSGSWVYFKQEPGILMGTPVSRLCKPGHIGQDVARTHIGQWYSCPCAVSEQHHPRGSRMVATSWSLLEVPASVSMSSQQREATPDPWSAFSGHAYWRDFGSLFLKWTLSTLQPGEHSNSQMWPRHLCCSLRMTPSAHRECFRKKQVRQEGSDRPCWVHFWGLSSPSF